MPIQIEHSDFVDEEEVADAISAGQLKLPVILGYLAAHADERQASWKEIEQFAKRMQEGSK